MSRRIPLRVHIDNQKDTILMLKMNTTTRRYLQRSIEESHTTMTIEPDGAYRCHFTVEKNIFSHTNQLTWSH